MQKPVQPKLVRRTKQPPLKSKRFSLSQIYSLRRHPVMVPVAAFLLLCLFSLSTIFVMNGDKPKFKPINSYVVLLSHDRIQQVVPTNEKTVGNLLTKIGINLNPGDVVEPSSSTPITQDYFHINVYRAVPVEIIDNGMRTFAFSAATTPRSIANQAGITLYPEDDVNLMPTNNFVLDGSIGGQVVINRATPVNLNVYGTATLTRTHAKTVAALLSAENIVLHQGDSVQPDPPTAITANMQVFLLRKGTKIETVQQVVPAPTQIIQDNSLTFGTSAVRQQGSNGSEVLTYQDNLVNNQVVSRTLIQTVVTQPAVPEIIAQGQAVQIPSDKAAVMAEAGISSSDYPYVNYIVSNESGWCPTKQQGQIGYCPGYAPSSMPPYLGYGLGQATPGTKMSGFGADWETNPVTQLRWATAYADATYGSWAAAYNHWYSHHNW